MNIETAVIVINYNGKKHLQECFSSLIKQSYAPLRLYLLDNASTDGSVEFVKEHFPSVIILAMDKGYGFAGGYNRAVAKAQERYLGMISNDTRVDVNWVKYMRIAMDADPRIAIAGSAGQRITPVGIGYEVGLGEPDGPDFNHQQDFAAVCGAGIMVRKNLFEKLGGFDESYFLLCEDTDLCWRAWMSGYRVVYQPQAFLFHKFGATIGRRETPLRVMLIQRNSIASVIKNRQAAYIGYALCGCLAYACARLIFFLLKGESRLLKAQLTGLAALFPLLPELKTKRGQLQAARAVSDAELLRKGILSSWRETIKEYFRIQRIGLTG
jgi:GT2 family glycosyltransferase